MKHLNYLFLAFTLLLASFSAHALVAVTNGNYFTGSIDVVNPSNSSGFELKVERTYNSRSQYDGIFGYGWGTDFEPFGVMHADGSIVIHENGGGDRTRFIGSFTKESAKQFAERLTKAYFEKNKRHMSRGEMDGLLQDRYKREEMAKDLGLTPQIPEGTKLTTKQRGDKQVIVVTKNGFVREFGDGKKEHYEFKTDVKDHGVSKSEQRVLKGVYKVTQIIDPVKKQQLTFTYNKKGELEIAKQGIQQTLRFQYKNGKVVKATNKLGKSALYKYCPSSSYSTKDKCQGGDLVWVKDTSGSEYKYEYDRSRNLTKMSYPDGSSESITYWPPTPPGHGGVKSVVDRNGVKVEYSYWEDKADPKLHYKTTVKTTYRSGRSSTSSYEYFDKRRPDGTTYKYKLVTEFDGNKTETIYNECCGQPLFVKNSSGTTRFEYYDLTGLPKVKETPTEITEWKYDDVHVGKISNVKITTKTDPQVVSETKFRYHPDSGNLMAARTSDDRAVALKYDKRNRIEHMYDHKKRKITFKYNNDDKPEKIILDGIGSIEVIYAPGGAISEVKSQGGRSIAASVTSAFQNLLEIIRPAGVQPL